MSTIWTPSGEQPIRRDDPQPEPGPAPGPSGAGGAGGGEGEMSPEEVAAIQAQVHRELLEAPASVVITNHCIGLFQLAALHLDQEHPKLAEAQLAIDALAAVVEGLGGRLGDDARPLRDALDNLRLAFVEVKRRTEEAG